MGLYEVLTTADACRCPWPARGPTVACPGTVPRDRLFNGAVTVSGAGCRGSVVVPPPCGPVPAQTPCRLPYADAFQRFASSLTICAAQARQFRWYTA